MKPVTYDFDVITDAPAAKRRLPQTAERAPQPDAEEERRGATAERKPPGRQAAE